MGLRPRSIFFGSAMFAVLILLGLIIFAPPSGAEHAEFAQFLGRFHPLIIHLPIALLLLAPVLEFAGFYERGAGLRQSTEFVLALATAGAIAAVSLGWLLAWSGGYDGPLVRHHMWGGISVAAASLGCCWLFTRNRRLALVALLATVGLTAWTSDQGGKLTYGTGYWTEHMPAPLRALLDVSDNGPVATRVDPASFYATRVQPIFSDKCVSCHSSGKHKGNLRLDSYENLMRGGKDGRVILAGDPRKSDLFRRITLPPDSKSFMPAEGKPALTADETKVIEIWIKAGATPQVDQKLLAGLPASLIAAPEPKVADYRPKLKMMAALQTSLNIRLVPRSQDPTDGLILRTAGSPDTCSDATLAKLAPVAGLIVDAELARTKVTDAGMATLAKSFSNLRFLDLSHTAVTASGMKAIAQLSKLESLNLTDTKVDSANVAELRSKPTLKKLFLFESR